MNYFQRKYIPKKHIKTHIRKQFVNNVGYEPDFDKPKTFNEKIQWLKLHYRDPLLTQCADKYAVRKYVNDTIGKEFLVDLLGVYSKVSDIDFNALPEKFVLKTNNGSGTNIICKDKNNLNIEDAKHKLNKWLRPEASHYYFSYEWCYKNIEPKIICEKFIDEASKEDLKDYKFLCFNGKVEMLFVCSERTKELKVDFFDLDWNKLPFTRHYKNSTKKLKKPVNFDRMVELAEKLSKPFPFVRVDLYEAGNKIMFGELTFYPGNGIEPFSPMEYDYKLGELLHLPNRSTLWGRSKGLLPTQ